jgi:putative FmdB family regulatory protein
MPVYEFYCSACSHIEEILQKVNDPYPIVCTVCGKEGTMSKHVSQTSFQLKGSGWYNDLYASPKAKPDTNPKTDKPEPKSEPKANPDTSTSTPKI